MKKNCIRIIAMLLCLCMTLPSLLWPVAAAETVKITAQPKSVTVAEGAKATVTVKATGEGLTYRWYYKDAGASNYTYTSSFKGNTYSVVMTAARSGRRVLCKVSDKYGNTVQSSSALLSMKAAANPVKITSQPKSVTVAKGGTVKISLTATGDGLTYTWYFKNKGAATFSKTTSFTGNSYSVKMDDTRNGRQVYCLVKDKYGNTAKSTVVTMSLPASTPAPVKITVQPKSVTVAEGETAKVTVTASGDGLAYTWFFRNKGAANFSKTTAFTGNTYSVAMDATRDGRELYCEVTDKYGNSVKSDTVTIRMKAAADPVKITVQPQSVTVAEGETAKVTLTASGDGLTYTWFFRNKGAANFSKTTAFTGNTYSVAMDATRDGRELYCQVADQYGNSVKSDTVTIRMKAAEPLKITTQPQSVTVEEGETARVSFTATGDGLTYTWYYKNKDAASFSTTATFTGNSYSVKMDPTRDGRQVYCEVKDRYGNSLQTDTVTLSMKSNALTVTPRSKYVAVRKYQSANLSITVSDGKKPYSYQWQIKNTDDNTWSDLDRNSAIYSISDYSAASYMSFEMFIGADSGTKTFRCAVTDSAGDVAVSDEITVYRKLEITTQPRSVSVKKGETAKIELIAAGQELSYTWYCKNETDSDFQKTDDFTYRRYSVKMDEAIDGQQVYCVVSDVFGNTVQSDTVTLSMVREPLSIRLRPETTDPVTVADTLTVAAEVTGGKEPYRYQWYEQYNYQTSSYAIEGANSAEYVRTISENDRKYNVSLYCTVSDEDGNQLDSIVFTPAYSLWIKSQSTSPQDAAIGIKKTLLVTPAGGSGKYTYAWEVYDSMAQHWYAATGFSWIEEETASQSALKFTVKQDWYDKYSFRCKVFDGTDTVYTETVSINVILPPLRISYPPQNATAGVGETAYFMVTAADGTTPYRYQWQYRCDGEEEWRTLQGSWGFATDAPTLAITVTMAEFTKHYQYRCQITDAEGQKIVTNAVKVLPPALTVRSQPQNVSARVGDTVSFLVEPAGGAGGYIYQWQSTCYGSGWTNMTGQTQSTLSFKVTDTREFDDEYRYRCIITDAMGNSVSTDTVWVQQALTVTTQPRNQTGRAGDILYYSVDVAGGSAPYNYQWYMKAQSGQWIESTVNSDTYKFEVNMITVQQIYSFYCVITDADGNTVTTQTATFAPA